MNHLNQSLMANFFWSSASYADARATRAPESEKQFWLGRAAAARAAGTLKNISAVELVLKLEKTHCSTPAFATLCENLRTS
jgi:hypothetical protein